MKKFMIKTLVLSSGLAMCFAATACSGGDDGVWGSYFEFENVTASRTIVQNYAGDTRTYTTNDLMKQDGNVWKLEEQVQSISGTQETVVYWDGAQIHAQSDSSWSDDDFFYMGDTWFDEIQLFRQYEDLFEETDKGVFDVEEIRNGSFTFTDVHIVIVGEKLQSISYTNEWDSSMGTITQVIEVSFYDWGTTVVEE